MPIFSNKDHKETASIILERLKPPGDKSERMNTTIDPAPESDPDDEGQMGILTAADELSSALGARDSRGIVNSLRSLIEMISLEREQHKPEEF